MSADSNDAMAQRITEVLADRQVAAATPDPDIAAAVAAPDLRLPQIIRTALQGYSPRPALGQRARKYTTDPVTGRTSAELLPHFETISYGELWSRVSAVAAALADATHGGVRAGDRVCMLGFTSVDYTTVDLALLVIGAVPVPLQTSAPVTSLRPIVEETEPVLIACSVGTLDDAEHLTPARAGVKLLVFDVDDRLDDETDAIARARNRAGEHAAPEIITLPAAINAGRDLADPETVIDGDLDALALLLYTSGSTGTPKGAIYTEALMTNIWQRAAATPVPFLILSFMPMSHMLGRGTLYMTLASGGTAYFAAKSDLSTFLDDLALVRPTQLHFVPRIWEMLYQEFQNRLARTRTCGADAEAAAADVRADLRETVIGGRYIAALTASAPISTDLRTWAETMLETPLREAYGATEVRGIMVNGRIQRPPVTDYKLVDVPELGYFSTDRPYPRGELYVKSDDAVAGYYRRPDLTAEMWDAEGWYHTGDIVAEIAQDHIAYVDRRNNVLKLSQGEFVAVSKLETVFGSSPLVRQIYIYANSARSYLLAVVVPTQQALDVHDVGALKPLIASSLMEVAQAAGLQSYEIPRDFIIETRPFSLENGLLTGIRKLAWPKLKERYGPALEQMYSDLAEGQTSELNELRQRGADQPTLTTVSRAAAALLGSAATDADADAYFTDLGGDSLSALTFANLLADIYDVEVPVGVIVSPATDLRTLAGYIDDQRRGGEQRVSFASVHGRDASTVHARDLTLEKFFDSELLGAATSLPGPAPDPRTVLLTGATGFLGRYLALQWLERMASVDGVVICLVRAKDAAAARQRLDAVFDSGDASLLARYRELSAHLEVISGDKAEPDLGLDERTWRRLAETVDLIVDPAALVNHLLPYRQLFGPNVVGTAELIRLALTVRLKPVIHVSTVAVGTQVDPERFVEDADVRSISPSRSVNDTYANGYANSKWAGEVLLREAHEHCRLPVTVFRSNMILAEPVYRGQLNVPDMFTRLILSLVASGVAPASFYQRDADGKRQQAHYDGLPVDFIAEAITVLGADNRAGHLTYHVMNPHDDGIGLDEFVDWLTAAGCSIRRIDDHSSWRHRFETALRALPERQRQASVLPLMEAFGEPLPAMRGALGPTDRFRAAVQVAEIGECKDIPHITPAVIDKYVADLRHVGLL